MERPIPPKLAFYMGAITACGAVLRIVALLPQIPWTVGEVYGSTVKISLWNVCASDGSYSDCESLSEDDTGNINNRNVAVSGTIIGLFFAALALLFLIRKMRAPAASASFVAWVFGSMALGGWGYIYDDFDYYYDYSFSLGVGFGLMIGATASSLFCWYVLVRNKKVEPVEARQRLIAPVAAAQRPAPQQRAAPPTRLVGQATQKPPAYAAQAPLSIQQEEAPPAYVPQPVPQPSAPALTMTVPARDHWTLPENPRAWTVTAVATWLRTVVELPDPIVNVFVSNGINGECLQDAAEDAGLDSLGITVPLQRARIKRAVQSLFA
eukprot:m.288744 g.288744  ORF g.288744 m.288744 type:complete len:323 (+) comp55053_c0_seq4:81-1049(+)